MFMFNNQGVNSKDAHVNKARMRYPLNSGQLNSHSGNGGFYQRRPMNEVGGAAGFGGVGSVSHQNYLEQLIKYQQVQLQQQQQQLLLAQQQYEYNLQLQYQYQLQHHLSQSRLNMHPNSQSGHLQRNITGGGVVCPQLYGQPEDVYSGAFYQNTSEELQVLEPYEIIILPKCDNTVTVRDVSHIDFSNNSSSGSKDVEIEVEIKKGDKDIELESVRDELLSEEKISMGSVSSQEIEVNVYELKNDEEDQFSEENVIQDPNVSDPGSVGSKDIEVDLKECYDSGVKEDQIFESESELEEVCLYESQGEIEIEEDSVLVIKYKNDKVGTDLLNLMEQNIDNCVIDGNSYYYENFVRSLSSGDYSSYEVCTDTGLVGLGDGCCYYLEDSSPPETQHLELIEISSGSDQHEEEQEKEHELQSSSNLDAPEIKEEGVDTKNEDSSLSSDKEALEELNEKIQRFNLLLEKINKMEQMNISFKEAFLSERWNLSTDLATIESKSLSQKSKTGETHSDDDKSVSECSILDTVKDIYDSNPQVIYRDSCDEKCISSYERLADIESELEQGEEQVQSYIQAINEYFAREGLLGACESRLNTHRWERNFESAMSSLNSQFKDSYGSDSDSEFNGYEAQGKAETEHGHGHGGNEYSQDQPDDYVVNESGSSVPDSISPVHGSIPKQSEHAHIAEKGTGASGAQLVHAAGSRTSQESKRPSSPSGTILLSNSAISKTPKGPAVSHKKVRIPMVNIPNSNDSSTKLSSLHTLNESQNEARKKGKLPTHKHACSAGNEPTKDSVEKDDEILARLSQCRVINSKTIKQAANSTNNNLLNKNTLNPRSRMNTCSATFSNSNNTLSTYNNLNQHASGRACEKITRGPVYNAGLGGKGVISQNKPHVSVQMRKEPNLGFKSLITSGIKVNVAELMKPRVIRKL
ncbi:hypothetical protein OIY81_2933 [Cryptosporidium canis]|nr:hypothetical protein OIY81_2933 [Cryptosporidium canis]